MKKSEYDGKTIVAITINGEPLLEVYETQKEKFYNLLLDLSNKYKLVLITDMPNAKSILLIEEIGLKDGFVINNCGSSIYDIKNKKIIMNSNIKKNKILPIFRQAAIDGDSIIIHTNKKIYIYSYHIRMIHYVRKSLKNISFELIEEYDNGIKNIIRNKVEALEVVNTFYDTNSIDLRNEKIHSLCESNELIYNEVNSSRILVVDNTINQALDFIANYINMKFTEIFLINLTNIFHNQNITSSYEYNSNNSMEEIFYNRTFFTLENEFKRILIENNFIENEE